MLNKARLVKLGLLGIFAGGLLLFFLLGGQQYVSFEAIKESRETLLDYKEQHFWRDAVSGTTLLALALLGAIGLAAIFAKNYIFTGKSKPGSANAH